ncbi:ABC transporter permease [Streptomyces hirsutus]
MSYSHSTVTERQWRQWSEAGVESAEPLGITTTKNRPAGDRSTGVSAFGVRPGSRLAPGGGGISDSGVVLSTAAADDLDVRAGDSLTLAGQRLRVAAVRGNACFSHTRVVWTSLDVWQRAAPPPAPARAPPPPSSP